jgi:hypothetical protein
MLGLSGKGEQAELVNVVHCSDLHPDVAVMIFERIAKFSGMRRTHYSSDIMKNIQHGGPPKRSGLSRSI